MPPPRPMYEPIVALCTMKLGGRPVAIILTREETFTSTRVRHAFDMLIKSEVDAAGKMIKRGLRINSNGGAYAAHTHAVTAYAITNNFQNYPTSGVQVGESSTAYTNLPSAAALRGYGIPQLAFAMESEMDDIALAHGWDPVDLRLKNIQTDGFIEETLQCRSCKCTTSQRCKCQYSCISGCSRIWRYCTRYGFVQWRTSDSRFSRKLLGKIRRQIGRASCRERV